MKICYVILTCELYLETRCKWVRDTWLKSIAPHDEYVFLSAMPRPESHVVGWNTPDTYEGCAEKYTSFLKHAEIAADWYVFVDDDTFVFPTRLRTFLASLDSSTYNYAGKLLDGPIPTMSGGAGFALSRSLFSHFQTYVRTHRFVPSTHYSDVTIGELVQRTPGTLYTWNRAFNSHPHFKEGDVRTAITFHYVTQDLFSYYSRFLE
jgi:hypothetical protein